MLSQFQIALLLLLADELKVDVIVAGFQLLLQFGFVVVLRRNRLNGLFHHRAWWRRRSSGDLLSCLFLAPDLNTVESGRRQVISYHLKLTERDRSPGGLPLAQVIRNESDSPGVDGFAVQCDIAANADLIVPTPAAQEQEPRKEERGEGKRRNITHQRLYFVRFRFKANSRPDRRRSRQCSAKWRAERCQ